MTKKTKRFWKDLKRKLSYQKIKKNKNSTIHNLSSIIRNSRIIHCIGKSKKEQKNHQFIIHNLSFIISAKRLFYNSRRREAFTLIELLVVITILGILSTAGIQTFSQAQAKARDGVRLQNVTAIGSAILAAADINELKPYTVANLVGTGNAKKIDEFAFGDGETYIQWEDSYYYGVIDAGKHFCVAIKREASGKDFICSCDARILRASCEKLAASSKVPDSAKINDGTNDLDVTWSEISGS